MKVEIKMQILLTY